MCFSAAASSENVPGSMNFSLEDGAGFLDQAIQRGGHPGDGSVDGEHMALDVGDAVAGVQLIPASR